MKSILNSKQKRTQMVSLVHKYLKFWCFQDFRIRYLCPLRYVCTCMFQSVLTLCIWRTFITRSYKASLSACKFPTSCSSSSFLFSNCWHSCIKNTETEYHTCQRINWRIYSKNKLLQSYTCTKILILSLCLWFKWFLWHAYVHQL